MPRVNPLISSINAGEFSPRMAARVDFQKYPAAAETLENIILWAQGAMSRRPGTRFVAEVKDSAKAVELLEFEFSTEQAYIIEAGELYMRFFKDQGRIVAGNTDAAITNGDFALNINGWDDRSTGTGAISHDAAGGRLNLDGTGGANIAWAEQAAATTSTGIEHVLRFRVAGAPGDVIEGRIGATSTGNEILDDKEFRTGTHTIAFTPSAGPFYVQFRNKRGKTVRIDDVALLDNAPVELVTPYAEADLRDLRTAQTADVMYITHPRHPVYRLGRSGHESWSLERVLFNDGPYLDINADSAKTITPSALSGLGVTLTATGHNPFQATDIGRLVRLKHGGLWGHAIVTGFTSSTVVTADVLQAFNAPGGVTADWALGAWSETTGYPRTVKFSGQRSVYGGSPSQTQTYWLSQSAVVEDMMPDSAVPDTSPTTHEVQDDDAMVYTIAADQVNAINGIAAVRDLLIFTSGGEWQVRSQGAVLTPTDIDAKRQTKKGSSGVDPLQVDHTAIFVQRAGRKVYEAAFNFEVEGFVSNDMTILADHVTRSRILEMAYQQEPDSTLFCVRGDGQIATLTLKREEDVVGWSRQILGGAFAGRDPVVESVATIPGDEAGILSSIERDEVWTVVKRTIGGQIKRYIEFFERPYETGEPVETVVYVDSALSLDRWNTDTAKTLSLTAGTPWAQGSSATMVATGHGPFLAGDVGDIWNLRYDGETVRAKITGFTSASQVAAELMLAVPESLRDAATHEWLDPDDRVTVVTGLDHLEGETAKVLADGAVAGDFVVVGGSITLPIAAGAVVAGLAYRHRYKSLKFNAGAAAGTAVGKVKRIHAVTLVMLSSMNVDIGPDFDQLESIPFRRVSDPMDTAIPLFTGERRFSFGGDYGRDSRIAIEGDDPLPWVILAMAPELSTNEMV